MVSHASVRVPASFIPRKRTHNFTFFFSILMQLYPQCQILLSKYLCVWDCSHPLKGLAVIILCLLDGRCCCPLGQLLLNRWDCPVVAQLRVSPGCCSVPVSFLTPLFVLRPCHMQYGYLSQLTICLSLDCPPKGHALRWALGFSGQGWRGPLWICGRFFSRDCPEVLETAVRFFCSPRKAIG